MHGLSIQQNSSETAKHIMSGKMGNPLEISEKTIDTKAQ
jgi:hypothetical protein